MKMEQYSLLLRLKLEMEFKILRMESEPSAWSLAMEWKQKEEGKMSMALIRMVIKRLLSISEEEK